MGYARQRQMAAQGPAAFLDLIPALAPDALPAATRVARDLDDPELRARALLAIRERTGSATLDAEILAAARAAGDARPELLLAWAAFDPVRRGGLLVKACRAAPGWDRGRIIANGVAIAAPDTLGPLVGLAESLGQADVLPILRALDRRAGELPREVRDAAIRLARAPRAVRVRDERLGAVLHLLDANERGALVSRWWGLAAQGLDDPRVIAAIPWLEMEDRRGLVASGLLDPGAEPFVAELVRALQVEDRVALFGPALVSRSPRVATGNLAALAAALPAESRGPAAAEVEGQTSGARRVELLGALVWEDPDALATCLSGVRDPARAATWAAVVLAIPGDPRPEIAKPGVRVARLLTDERTRLRLLALLAPVASGRLRTSVMRDVLAALPAQARQLDWQHWAALALAAEPREAEAAIRIVRATLRGTEREDVVATLAPALDDERLVVLLADLARSRPAVAVQILSATATSMSGSARHRAMDAVAAIRRPGTRAVARAHLIAIRGKLAGSSLARPSGASAAATLDLARRGDDGDVSEVLHLLHDQLPPDRTLEAALDLEPGARAMILAEVRTSLPRELRLRADAALAPLEVEGYAGGGMGAGGDEAGGMAGITGQDAAAAMDALFPTAASPGPPRRGATRGIDPGMVASSLGAPAGAIPRGGPGLPGLGSTGAATGGAAMGAGGAAADAAALPPHVAYGHLDAPTEVVADVPFILDVGLSPIPAPGVAAAALRLPGLTRKGYLLDIRIAAPGFLPAPGESRRRSLPVALGKAHPTTTVTLIPKPVEGDQVSRRITAEFWVAGERLGDAVRYVTVLASDDLRTRPQDERVETGVDVPAPTGTAVPDLTITIRKSDPPGHVEWTFDSPHRPGVQALPDPISVPLEDAAQFLRDRIEQVDSAEGQPGVFTDVLALGHRIAGLVPAKVWQAIRAAAVSADGPPTILLQCEEAYIPWELAEVKPPLREGTDLPPFLAAQARVSRWVATRSSEDGVMRPPANPPVRKTVASVGVVWGSYRGTRWGNLVHASREGRTLKKRYAATRVIPNNRAMFNLLKNDPSVDLLHFAVHGRYDPGDAGNEDGILLVDGNVLHANEVAARDLASHPIVFLNACQLAAGKLELGAYSGVAAAFIEAGASAVVAPLWKVDDEIAMQMAFDFYDAIGRGEMLSEVLRHARERFVDVLETDSATWMAYQLFAHPSFTVDGLKPT